MKEDLIYICEICQTILQEHHCKAQCPNCGRMFDCSDLPLIPANGMIDEEDGQLTLRPGANPLDLLPGIEISDPEQPDETRAQKPKRNSASDSGRAQVANLP